MSGFGFDRAAGEEQIADETVADVAPQARDSAEAGDETKSQLGKTEARHFVGDNEIAEDSKFEAAAHAQAVNGGKGNERSGINGIGHAVDALDKHSQAGDAFPGRKFHRVVVELFQVAAGAGAAGA